jgi:hypothetical protein
MVGALGVVFGDIGTSPLYTMSAVFGGTGKGGINAAEVYGATSTLIWSMAVIVSLLYVRLLMRTDNDGEGGLLALVALLRRNVTSPRAAVLAVTGAEALYADLGHFGRKAIARAWVRIVFPALTITYLGEAAAVVRDPAAASSPFFALIPSWALWPAVVLATLATVIASQAVISGAYTVVHQGAGLGLFPPLRTQHTSRRHFGQIYTPRRRPLAVPPVEARGVSVHRHGGPVESRCACRAHRSAKPGSGGDQDLAHLGGQALHIGGERKVLLQQAHLPRGKLLAVCGIGCLPCSVPAGLGLLRDHHHRRRVVGDGRENEVEKDERCRVEALAVEQPGPRLGEEGDHVVHDHPRRDDHRRGDNELHRSHRIRDALGHPRHQALTEGTLVAVFPVVTKRVLLPSHVLDR